MISVRSDPAPFGICIKTKEGFPCHVENLPLMYMNYTACKKVAVDLFRGYDYNNFNRR